MPKDSAPAPFELPSDLAGLADEELASLIQTARAEGQAILNEEGGPKAENLERAKELHEALGKLKADQNRRVEQAAQMKAQFDEIAANFSDDDATPAADPAAPDATTTAPAAIEGEIVDAASAPAPQPIAASGRPVGGAITASRELGGVGRQAKINPSLSGARTLAPATSAPAEQLAITASADLPGTALTAGARITDMAQLAELVEHRARSLPVTQGWKNGQAYGGVNVARIQHNYPTVFNESSSQGEVEKYLKGLRANLRPSQMESLVASGGWCAPSEIRYSFFNIACAGGMIDLPTFGVQRGGLRWPISPSLADAFTGIGSSATSGLAPFNGITPSNTTMPWVWTETNDVVAATGTLFKPCVRVPCVGMNEARLECYGVCVTAGNLADSAWPESTRNWLQLLDVAFQHTMNFRYIQTIRGLTTDGGTLGCTGVGAISPILDAVELAAIDYRKRYAMCRDDVIEVVFPDWVLGPMRQDVARRTGLAEFNVTDEMIMSWFNVRHVRVQLVDDYQVRAAGQPGYSTIQTTWPATVEFMLYAPGTFGLGNGMSLDLGVVRDSTLNSTNDFTAAWYEQCHMIAQFGHAARRYVVPICGSGVTGAANITSCC